MRKSYFDAIVIGGGFYGSSLGIYLRKYFKNVAILEKESSLMTHASYTNQARVHNGYHYPRSYLTANRSHANYNRFLKDFNSCIDDTSTNIYAVAKNNSFINANRFQDFCNDTNLPLKKLPAQYKKYFNEDTVEESFLAKEAVFNTKLILMKFKKEIRSLKISVFFNTEVVKITQNNDNLQVHLPDGSTLQTKYVFNCTYSQINPILQRSNLPLLPFKYELTELALIKVPPQLRNIGVTVIDGPFFSFLPFPEKNLHTLSHVSYTPHAYKQYQSNKLHILLNSSLNSQFLYMIKDAQRFIPSLKDAKYVKSLYEVKTVLLSNENDDGRPILFKKDYGFKNLFVIMGGKIDNIYDVYSALDKELGHQLAI